MNMFMGFINISSLLWELKLYVLGDFLKHIYESFSEAASINLNF